MSEYSSSSNVNVSANAAFGYLSDVTNLPAYFPRITAAEKTSGDSVRVTARIEKPGEDPTEVAGEAWFRVDDSNHTLAWGAEGPNNYRGELDFDETSSETCTLTVRIDTENVDATSVQQGLDEAVQGIKSQLESKA